MTIERISLVLVLSVLAATAGAQHGPAGPDEAAMTPVKILLEMERAYADARSYRDTGTVTALTLTDGGRAGSERPFVTVFVRPDRFRFQFTDPGLGERSSRYIVWTDGREVRSWWDAKPGVRYPQTLEEALSIAAGISGASSVRVPGLLLPKTVGVVTRLVAPERLADGVERGVTCLRIRGKSRKTPFEVTMGGRSVTVEDESVTYWIDRASFLLRKIEETRTYETYRSETTTIYTPELNPEIPADQLAFNAPETP